MLTDRISNCIQELFGFFPSKTWVSNRFSINVFTNFLISRTNITFDHYAFDQFIDDRRFFAVVHYFLDDTNLFFVLFVGIGMVCIHNTCRIYQIHFFIHFIQANQIFVVVVGDSNPAFVDCTTQDNMSQWIAGSVYLPSAMYEMVRMLGSIYRI